MRGEIKNKITEAGLITIDLLDFLSNRKHVGIDLRGWLIDDLIIKEVDFKERLKKLNIAILSWTITSKEIERSLEGLVDNITFEHYEPDFKN